MKKTLIVAALAVALVLAFSASAFAVGPFLFGTGVGEYVNSANYPGYLSWGYAVLTDGANNVGSPHGNYTTSTNKCAVCHSVHQASGGANVLTPVPGNLNTGAASTTGYTKGCVFCHAEGGSGFSVKVAPMGMDGTISPHGNCSRCHIASPHGVGTSIYPVLASALINTNADDQIGADLAATNNGLVADYFDATASGWDTGRILGTGYLCNDCHTHGTGSNELAFPVNRPNALPTLGEAGVDVQNVTGHRVTAVATSNWNQPGYTLPDGAGAAFTAYYTGGGAAGNQSVIAWADAFGCKDCHDATSASGAAAFPHGYVDNTGAYATKGQAGASIIWLQAGSYAGSGDLAIVGTPAGGTSSANRAATVNALTEDGLCLKCHAGNGGLSGVGIDF